MDTDEVSFARQCLASPDMMRRILREECMRIGLDPDGPDARAVDLTIREQLWALVRGEKK